MTAYMCNRIATDEGVSYSEALVLVNEMIETIRHELKNRETPLPCRKSAGCFQAKKAPCSLNRKKIPTFSLTPSA